MRKIEWIFVILFIFSGLYCLSIPMGMPMVSIPLPKWMSGIVPYAHPIALVLAVIGTGLSLWGIFGKTKDK